MIKMRLRLALPLLFVSSTCLAGTHSWQVDDIRTEIQSQNKRLQVQISALTKEVIVLRALVAALLTRQEIDVERVLWKAGLGPPPKSLTPQEQREIEDKKEQEKQRKIAEGKALKEQRRKEGQPFGDPKKSVEK